MPDYPNILDIPPGPYILLPTPELIITNVSGAWTTINNATLAGANASYALLSIIVEMTDNDDVDAEVNMHLRQTGSGLAANASTIRAQARGHGGGGMGTTSALGSGDVVVPIALDNPGRDFDYYITLTNAPDSWTVVTYLLGYR